MYRIRYIGKDFASCSKDPIYVDEYCDILKGREPAIFYQIVIPAQLCHYWNKEDRQYNYVVEEIKEKI